jgi:hypothetical protein
MHEVWATSPDNAVSVRAVAGGVPVEVRLAGHAMRMTPEALARSVLATAGRAGREASMALHRELAASVGVEATRTLERAGLPAPESPERPERPERPESLEGPHDPDDPDDFGRVLWSTR